MQRFRPSPTAVQVRSPRPSRLAAIRPLACAAICLLGAVAAHAAAPDAGPAPAAPPATAVPEPKVERLHAEDQAVSVDELRVRGVTQRITVTPKNGVAYDIVPLDASRDPTSRSGPGAGSVGRRIWNIFQF